MTFQPAVSSSRKAKTADKSWSLSTTTGSNAAFTCPWVIGNYKGILLQQGLELHLRAPAVCCKSCFNDNSASSKQLCLRQ
eukprot:2655326-Amphidinium_carterae.1